MTHSALHDLVHLEAALLDEQRFEEWLALYTQDCLYWVPVSPDMETPRDGPSHYRDDRQVMMVRTHRLANPRTFGAEPTPRTVHVISGLRTETASDNEVIVSSSQIVLEYRNRGRFEEDQRTFGGRVRHTFARVDDAWKIAEKRVDLINADSAQNAMAAPL
ncbi:MAG: aromatic-ring-hydroxylating dioxygenase subunit beta [Parerythrobacter sp.]